MKATRFKRFLCTVLCLVMVISMLPVTAALAETTGVTVKDKVADTSTADNWKKYFGTNNTYGQYNTQYAGGVWTDKSVYANDNSFSGITMRDETNNFLVALSALAANTKISGQAQAPTDTILVLDVSGSMDDSNSVTNMVRATNRTLDALLGMNNKNRVGVVLYSGNSSFGASATGTATVILPLDYYTTTSSERVTTGSGRDQTTETIKQYLTGTNENNSVGVASGTRNSANAKPTGSKSVVGGTYIQNGLYKAWGEFNKVTDTTDGATRRTPILVLMSDGAPTTVTTNYNAVGDSNAGNGGVTTDSMVFLTQLTAAWVKAKMSDKYDNTAYFYTVGLGTSNDSKATSVLNPSSVNNTTNELWRNYLRLANGVTMSLTLPDTKRNPSNFTTTITRDTTVAAKNYVDGYYAAKDAEDLTEKFESIVGSIELQQGYHTTLITSGDPKVDGYITFEDELGAFMEVKAVHGIVIGDTVFSGEEMASKLNDGTLGRPGDPTNLGNELVWSVQERLGISSTSTAQQLLNAAYASGQLSHSDSGYSNYIGWYADSNNNFLGHWAQDHTEEDRPANAAYINRSYAYLGKTGSGNIGQSDMMHIVVQVHTNIDNGHQSVKFAIPASLIPTVSYKIEMTGTSLEDPGSVTMTYEAADPIQLLVEVGLRSGINAVNIDRIVKSSDHFHLNDQGEYVFYSNRWGKDEDHAGDFDYSDPHGHLVAVSLFEPSLENERYYYTVDTPVLDGNHNPVKSVTSGATYYYAKNIVVGTGSSSRVVTVYEQISSATLSAARTDAEGYKYIAKNTPRKLLDQNMTTKSTNPTGTLIYSNYPVTEGTQTGNIDVYTFLGNNGTFTVAPASGFTLTKKVTEPIEGISAYTFNLAFSADCDPVFTDLDGKPISGVTAVTNNDGTVDLTMPTDVTVYVTGVPAGVTCTVTEKAGEGYQLDKIEVGGTEVDTAVVTAATNYVPVVFTNAPFGKGELTVSKDVSHHYDTAPDALADKTFTFLVKLTDANGTALTGSFDTDWVDAENNTLQVTADANGEFTVTLHDNEAIAIRDLPEGTRYTVTETAIPDGFSIDDAHKELSGQIVARENSVAHFVNTYAVTDSVKINIAVSGTKTLSGQNYDAETFRFQLQRYNVTAQKYEAVSGAEGTTAMAAWTSGDSATGTYGFTVNELELSAIGTHYFRVVEVAGSTHGMTYDSTYARFRVIVTDNDMNGKLEANVEKLNGSTWEAMTDSGDGYAITKDFNNSYIAQSTYLDIPFEKTLTNRTGIEVPLSDFSFTLKELEMDATTGSYTEKANGFADTVSANAAGEGSFRVTYTAEGTYYYSLKEVAGTMPGMTYTDTEYIVTVVVANNAEIAELEVVSTTITYQDENQQTVTLDADAVPGFTNVYKLKEATVTISGSKTLTGRDLEEGEYSFEIWSADSTFEGNMTKLDTVTNNGEGGFQYSTKVASVGTYYYVVREKAGDNPGMTYDGVEYHVTVTVEKDSEVADALKVAKTEINKIGTNADTSGKIVFVNSYTLQSVSFAIPATKQMTGRTLQKDEFTFQLLEGEEVLQTVGNNANGAIHFASITYTEPGSYTYIVKELVPEGGKKDGVTYDPDNVKTVTVVVTDNGDGTMTAALKDGTAAPVFINSYNAASTGVSIRATKTLTGRDFKEGETFTFQLISTDSTFSESYSVTTKEFGESVNFGLSYSDGDEGFYYYILSEVIPADEDRAGGIGYDTTEYHITVSVSDDGSGQLHNSVTITCNGETVDSDKIAFNNIYTAEPVDVTLEGTKTLEHKELKENDFNFQLFEAQVDPDDGYVKTGDAIREDANDADGNFSFEPLTFTEAGDYYYIVVEQNDGQTDIRYDTTEYLVEIRVTDSGDGYLQQQTRVYNTEDNDISFLNVYDPTMTPKEGQVIVDVTKTIRSAYGNNLSLGGYQFTLSDDTGVVDTVTTFNDGKASFVLEYNEKDIGKSFTYTIAEKDTEKADIIYDETTYTLQVDVDVDAEGKLTTKVLLDEQETETPAVTFTNGYDPFMTEKTILVPVNVTKAMEFKTNAKHKLSGFTFRADALESGNFTTATSDAEGKAVFTLGFTEKDIGKTYNYQIKELDTDLYGVTYDTTVYNIAVTVGLNDAGELAVAMTLDQQTVETLDVTFTNIYDGPPTPPDTGDTMNLGLMIALLIVSGAALMGMAVIGKKKFF